MDEILRVAEIGTAGVAASVGALALGLYRVEFLMVIFRAGQLADVSQDLQADLAVAEAIGITARLDRR